VTTDDIVDRLSTANAQLLVECLEGIDIRTDLRPVRDSVAEIKQLRAERDEARRAIIILLAGTDIAAMHRLADERGWDCFKEVNRASSY
jgi:hypothetical protein